MRLVHRPTPSAVGIAVAPGVLAAVALGVHLAGFALAVAGVAVMGLGAIRGTRRVVTLGGITMFAGVLAAGIDGVAAAYLLLGAAGTIVAWTSAQHAVGLGHQLGREAPTNRSLMVHLASATIVTLTAGGFALAILRFTSTTLPPSAVVFLLAGAVALIYALKP